MTRDLWVMSRAIVMASRWDAKAHGVAAPSSLRWLLSRAYRPLGRESPRRCRSILSADEKEPDNPREPALDQPCKKRSRCRRSHSAASA